MRERPEQGAGGPAIGCAPAGHGGAILGARNLAQFGDNLAVLGRPLDEAALHHLGAVSALPPQFPYSFFEPAQQVGMHGGGGVGDKPAGYALPVWVDAAPGPVYASDANGAARR